MHLIFGANETTISGGGNTMTNHDEDRYEEIKLNNMAQGIWRTKDGRNIHVRDMSKDHLMRVKTLLARIGDPVGMTTLIDYEIEVRS